MTDLEKQLAEALRRIADPRNTHFAGDAQVVAREALAQFDAQAAGGGEAVPYCHVYEYDSPLGLHRALYPKQWNGKLPDRTIPVYTHPAPAPADSQAAPVHLDDAAVDALAASMKEKLADARAKGRSGWQTCPPEELSLMLREHVEKGDPRDVANFCAFLWALGAGISLPPVGTDNFDLWVNRGMGCVAADSQAAPVQQVGEREAFEAWCAKAGWKAEYIGDNQYSGATANRWWEAWQARAALAAR